MRFPTASSTKLWSDRVAEQLLQSGKRTLLVCHLDSGIEWAVRRLEIANVLTLRVWSDVSSKVPLKQRIAEAVERTFGHDLVDGTLPYELLLQRVRELLERVGPVLTIVGWVEHLQPDVQQFLAALPDNCQTIVVARAKPRQLSNISFKAFDSAFLAMRPEEARVAVSDGFSWELVDRAYKASSGKFGAFMAALDAEFPLAREEVNGPSLERQTSRALESVSEHVLRSLWKGGRTIEAFDLACTNLPSLVPDFVEKAGHLLFDCGAFQYLWDCLGVLPQDIRQHPRVAYWIYATGAATNRLHEVQDLAQSVLDRFDAPDLRAAVAVMRPGAHIDHETERAIRCAESPITVRARAFAQALCGDRHSPVLLLRRAMTLAEGIGANHLVIACALDLSNQEITLGRLQSGRDWAVWALGQINQRRLAEDYRQQTALAGATFASLLIGDLEEASRYVSDLMPDVRRIGVPTYESVISTLGDWHFLNGDIGEASFYYERNLTRGPFSQYASASLDVVKARIAEENYTGALQQAQIAHSISRTSSPLEKALGSLALGMALSFFDDSESQVHLREAQSALSQTSYAIFESQAHIWCARSKFEQGELEAARSSLEAASMFTSEMGTLGWSLLLANYGKINELIALQTSGCADVELEFLGKSVVRVHHKKENPSMRQCEILALLSDRNSGITGEQLQLQLFGDAGTIATTKATVSRLRKIVPISSAPYKIKGTVQADFVDLLEYLHHGQLHQALRLYDGPLLPGSDAPGIIELRRYIAECLRSAIMSSNDVDLLIQLATILEDDLEVWESAKAALSVDDRRRPLVNARIRRIKASW